MKKKKELIRGIIRLLSMAYILALLLMPRINCVEPVSISEVGIMYFLDYRVNLIPFVTIFHYTWNYIADSGNAYLFVYNIVGNLVMYFPMGVLLPCLVKRELTWKRFMSYMLIVLFGMEIIQMSGGTGIFDIDDMILNVTGAYIGFRIMKHTYVTAVCKRMYIMSNE